MANDYMWSFRGLFCRRLQLNWLNEIFVRKFFVRSCWVKLVIFLVILWDFFLHLVFFGIPINWLWPIFECRLFSIRSMRCLSHLHHQIWNRKIINHPFMYYTNHHGIGSKEKSPNYKKSASVHFTNFRLNADFLQRNLVTFMHPRNRNPPISWFI